MGVLSFDGVDDNVKSTSLSTELSNVSNGAWTMASVVRRGSATTFDAIAYLLSGSGAGTAEAGLSVDSADDLLIDLTTETGTLTAAFTNTTNPYLFVVAKPAGSGVAQYSWKLDSGGAWTSGNMSGTLTDQIASTMLEIGRWQGSDPFIGHIGLVAFWEGQMSQTDREALDDNWRTSDWWNSAHGQPASLIELNTLTPTDLGAGGGAASLVVTGATLDAAQTLNSWTFDGVGGAAAEVIPDLVMAPLRAA